MQYVRLPNTATNSATDATANAATNAATHTTTNCATNLPTNSATDAAADVAADVAAYVAADAVWHNGGTSHRVRLRARGRYNGSSEKQHDDLDDLVDGRR
jgi:hypothetical protein